jgi:hypothetical protein
MPSVVEIVQRVVRECTNEKLEKGSLELSILLNEKLNKAGLKSAVAPCWLHDGTTGVLHFVCFNLEHALENDKDNGPLFVDITAMIGMAKHMYAPPMYDLDHHADTDPCPISAYLRKRCDTYIMGGLAGFLQSDNVDIGNPESKRKIALLARSEPYPVPEWV